MKAIIKLQQLALDPKVKISELLNHAYLISSKLDVKEFSEWCNYELNGYFSSNSNIPGYRILRGSLNAAAVGKPIIPILVSGPDWSKYADIKPIYDSIPKLESWLSSDHQFISLRLDPNLEDFFTKELDGQDNELIHRLGMQSNPFADSLKSGYRPFLRIEKSDISNILSNVKKTILDWSINLEKQGIIGEDYIFTDEEKQMIQNVSYHIGNVGNMANHNDNSTINQTSTNTVQIIKGDFNSLASNLRSYGIEEADIQELKTIIDVTPLPQSPSEYSPDLKSWMAKMIGKSIDGTWQVAVGAAGSLLAIGIQQYFGILN